MAMVLGREWAAPQLGVEMGGKTMGVVNWFHP